MYNETVEDSALIGCLDCDLVQRLPALEPGEVASCERCGRELRRARADSLQRTLALALAAAVLYVVANTGPMLRLEAVGRSAETTVIGGAEHLWTNGRELVAGLVLLTAVVAPALQIGFALAVVLGSLRERAPSWVGAVLRHHPRTRTWSMIEVMMIGVLVALIKISELATVIPGTAFWALASLVFLLPAMQSSFDPHEVWERVEWVAERTPQRFPERGVADEPA